VALDRAAAGAVARELVGRGLSEAWAHELIVSAGAHLAPFRGGSLREAVHACLASAIAASPPLPAAGAAIAFVGAGGAGKTRCAAAMASAYRRASTLPVSVLSLGADGRGGPDAEPLLREHGIPVWTARGREAADAVARGRDGGLVVIDTRATSPVDTAGVTALASDLDPLALDAVLLAVPATLSASAARNLLDGLSPLQPSALVITHADETDELGIAVELAYLSGLPIAYVHGGLTLEGALWPADPSRVAARLLP
jgi:flagellar biosynthesis GTPase FlhF